MSAPFGGGPLRIITADERLREARGIKGVLTGTSGIGKTTQLLTLDPQRTLFLNLEAGELAVQGWPGDEIRIRDWEVARHERLREQGREAIERSIAAGELPDDTDVASLAAIILGATEGVEAQWLLGADVDPVACARLMARLVRALGDESSTPD